MVASIMQHLDLVTSNDLEIGIFKENMAAASLHAEFHRKQ